LRQLGSPFTHVFFARSSLSLSQHKATAISPRSLNLSPSLSLSLFVFTLHVAPSWRSFSPKRGAATTSASRPSST
jgi:hypothetical protein